MKKIDVTINVNACVPGFQEAFKMAELMNVLIDNINTRRALERYNDIDRNERNNYHYPRSKSVELPMTIDVEKVYDILVQHGYVGTGDIDILPDGYELVLRKQ